MPKARAGKLKYTQRLECNVLQCLSREEVITKTELHSSLWVCSDLLCAFVESNTNDQPSGSTRVLMVSPKKQTC